MAALERPSAANDRNIFSRVTWEPEILGGADFTIDYSPPQDEMVAEAERVALFYARRILEEADAVGAANLKDHERLMVETLRRLITEKGSLWIDDTEATIGTIIDKYPDQVDFKLMRLVNDDIGSVLRNEKQMVDVLFADNTLMKRFYGEGLGLRNTQRQISSYMKSIVHRYPRASVLEVGAGTGATTSAVLEAVGGTFGSYTFTDVSSGFFPHAEALFAEHADRMLFRKLDIAAPFEPQGFREAAYDVVIAANVLHITEDFDASLRRVRQLLKPGGYLIVTEPTSKLLRIQVILGGLEGWWCARDDEHTIAGPVRTCKTWDQKLRQNGFSGIDLLHHDQLDEKLHTCSSFVAQAVDDRVECIRSPLDSMHRLSASERIVIVGGSLLSTSKLARAVQTKLLAHGGLEVIHFEDIKEVQLTEPAYILMLSELDEPAFQTGYSEEVVRGVKNLLKHPKALLAVTKDAADANPFSHMLVGLFRGVRTENPSLKLQLLNLERSDADANTILEHFVRLIFATLYSTDDGAAGLLHTIEPQIALRNNATYLPRVVKDQTLNDRVNCRRRQILRPVSKNSHVVEVEGTASAIQLCAREKVGLTNPELIKIHVDYSTLLPVGALMGQFPQYICIGRKPDDDSGQRIVTISRHNASEVELRADDAFEAPSETIEPGFLGLMAIIAAVKAWLRVIPKGGVVCIHGADDAIIDMFDREASRKGVRVFTTSDDPKHPYFLHPHATPRQIRSTLPANIAAFIVGRSSEAAQTFLSTVQPKLGLPADLCGPLFGFPYSRNDTTTLQECIAGIYASANESRHLMASAIDSCPVMPVMSSQAIQAESRGIVPVLDWTSSALIPATIQPIDPATQLRSDRTYFLVGLTGEVGLSTCAWMISHGVRHVVLASRNPQMDQQRLRNMSKQGATIRMVPMDVTDFQSVQSAISEIGSTMPPVAGVCNGSMVLADAPFQDMDKAQIDTALRPKVQGSLNLDRAFSTHDLDFFIMMSSLGSIIGTPGQSNYHMANMFMAGLAADRRRRGLAGSVLDVGYIADIGYVSRQDIKVELKLRAMRMMPLCEEEVHMMFSEAIAAGRPASSHAAEIVTGLPVSNDDSKRPHWAVDPRLSHFVVDETKESATDTKKSGLSALQALHTALESPDDEDLLSEKIQAALSEQFETLLRLPAGAADMSLPLMSLGLDSLVAMEVQRWFRKNVKIEISALQILGGATGQMVCRAASASVLAKHSQTKEVASIKTPAPQADVSPTVINTGLPSMTGTSTPSSEESRSSSMNAIDPRQTSGLSTPSSTSTPRSGLSQSLGSSQKPDELEEISIKRERAPSTLKATPLSFAQARLWFLHQFLEDPTTYNETVLYNLSGPLDIKRLRNAFHQVAGHHEILRTRFQDGDGTRGPMQIVMNVSMCSFEYVSDATDKDVEAEYQSMISKTWNLLEGDCLGVKVIRRSPTSHALIMGSHHIAVDGVSWVTILRHWDMAYRSMNLPPAPGYAEFSDQQRQELENGRFSQEIDYWKQELDGVQDLPLLPMATATTRQANNRYDEVSAKTVLDAGIVSRVKQASRALHITPFHYYLGVLSTLISRLSNLNDFCIGTVDAGRSNLDFSETVGFFINIVPIRVSVAKDDSFESLCKNLWAKALRGLENSRVPFDALLDALGVPRTTRHSPLFQVVINYRLNVLGQEQMGDCAVKYVTSKGSGNPYDLCLNIMETPEGTCHVEMSAKAALYSTEAVQSILGDYLRILDVVPGTPEARITQLSLGRDNQELNVDSIDKGRGDVVDCEWEETVFRRISKFALSKPDAPAIVCERVSYSYRELMRQANVVAATLKRANVPTGPDAYCCLLFEGSVDHFASLLGIFKIAAVAVPLDTRNGKERLAVILDDCKPVTVLYHNQTTDFAQYLKSLHPQVPFMNMSTISTESWSDSDLEEVLDQSRPDAPATMFYTSGTTSKPKGVLVTNSNYIWINYANTRRLQLQSGSERILQQTSLGFDMSLMQALPALCNGNCLVVASARQRRDPYAIAELMADQAVTCTFGVPTEYILMFQHASNVLRRCTSLRTVVVGGEMFPLSLAAQFRNRLDHRLQVYNAYGPTEICINSHVGPFEYWRDDIDPHIPVGRTLDNVSTFVLDDSGQPVPNSCTGEIYIGGCGVGKGYLRRPELTSTKFLSCEFATPRDLSRGWGTMYRTGDRGFLRPDGQLVILGRVESDAQIKLRGIRIEMDDIAANIVSASKGRVAQAAVTARGEDKMLVGYAVIEDGADVSDPRFFETLAASLPVAEYMKPTVIIPIDELPKTINGKLDRKALNAIPLPDIVEENNHDVSTLTPLEEELGQIWKKILARAPANIQAELDFFRLGGNSVLLVELRKRIQTRWRVRIPLVDLFEASTLQSMAAFIRGTKESQAPKSEWEFWDKETQYLPPTQEVVERAAFKDSSSSGIISRAGSGSGMMTLLMTGSTTLLGSKLLELLVARPDVARIHCVAVSPEEQAQQQQLLTHEKIIVHEGSLGAPELGLSEETISRHQSEVDVILHAGAEGSCLNTYTSLSRQNVESTRFLLARLAAPRQLPLHYLSSARVVLFTGQNAWPEASVAGFYPPAPDDRSGREGFTATKWASEMLLEDFSAKTGSPVTIHRTGYLMSEEADNKDIMNMIHKYSVRLRAVPSMAKFSGFLDMSDVGRVAESFVSCLTKTDSSAEGVTYKHHTEDKAVPVGDLGRYLQEKHGHPFEVLPLEKWATKAEDAGMNPFLTEFLLAVVEKGEEARYPKLLKGVP